MKTLLAVALTASLASAEGIAWIDNDLDKALATAGEERKNIVVWWTADWLPKPMRLGPAFDSAPVRALLKGRLVPVRITWSAGAETPKALFDRYAVKILPTVLLLDSAGRIVARIEGRRTEPELAREIQGAIDLEGEIRGLEEAASQSPRNAAVRLAIARRFQEALSLGEAARHYQAALEIDPSLAGAWWQLANVERQRGRVEGVREAVEGFTRADPGNLRGQQDDILFLLASCEADSDPAAAGPTLARIEKEHPGGDSLPDALYLLAQIQAFHDGAYDAAGATLDRLARLAPSSPACERGKDLLATLPELKSRFPRGRPEWRPVISRHSDVMAVGIGEGSGGSLSARSSGPRRGLVAKFGGSKESEAAVQSALLWLARHQHADGHWSAVSVPDSCKGAGCRGHGLPDLDIAVTGLALLAFLGQGYGPGESASVDDPIGGKRDFGEVVDRACRWLLRSRAADGSLGLGEAGRSLHSHAIATLALVEASALSGDPDITEAARLAVRILASHRSPGGGWGRPAGGGPDTLDTGWCLLSLHVARSTGFGVPADALEGGRAWLDRVTDPSTFRAGLTSRKDRLPAGKGPDGDWDDHETLTAIGILGRIALDRNTSNEDVRGGLPALDADLPSASPRKIDALYWHFGTLAVFQASAPGDPSWRSWNTAMREVILKSQSREGCESGSWPDLPDRWGCDGGRVAVAALNAMTLEIYYRYPFWRK